MGQSIVSTLHDKNEYRESKSPNSIGKRQNCKVGRHDLSLNLRVYSYHSCV